MTKYCLIILLTLLVLNGYSQNKEIIVQLEEDYTNPKPMMWKNSSKHIGREIENGMYVSKALSAIGPELTFPSGINQLNCVYLYDAEFTFVKLKGDKKGFMGIEMQVWYRGENYYENFKNGTIDYKSQVLQKIYLKYNESGNWQLLEGNNNKETAPIKSGTTAVNQKSNKLKVMHHKNKFEFYLNDAKICEWGSDKSWQSAWNEIKFFAESEKFQIALDQIKLTGYFDKDNREVILDDIHGLNGRGIRYKNAFAVKEFGGTKLRVMDNRGRMQTEEYDEIETNSSPGKLIKVKRDGLYGYVTNTGAVVFPCEFKEASSDYCTSTGKDCRRDFYLVKDKNNKKFFVNEKGLRLQADVDSRPFFAAIKNNDTLVVKSLLKDGVDVNSKDENGSSALFSAIKYKNEQFAMVKILVDAGADVNFKPEEGRNTVLAWAANSGGAATVRYLLEKGADPNKGGGISKSIFSAVYSNYLDILKLLINAGADYEKEKGAENQHLKTAREKGYMEMTAYLEGLLGLKQIETKIVSKPGMEEIKTSEYKLSIYSNWIPYHQIVGTSYVGIDASLKNSPAIFSNGPSSWLNQPTGIVFKKGISGSMRIEWEERASTFEKEKENLVSYFAKEKATRWDKVKSTFTNPTPAEIAKAKPAIKILEESITMSDGRKGKSLFYCADVSGLGIRLAYIIIIPDLKNTGKISYYELYLGGEPNQDIKPENFKEWKDYFKKVMLTINQFKV